jgi:hypothetical protein
MSTILVLIASALVALCAPPDAHASAIISRPLYLGLDQGLVGYWSFEGKTVSGTQVYDASGNGNRGTMTNGPTLVYGKIGQGMEFTTLNNTVSVSNNSVFKTIPLSISFWMKMNILPSVRGENERPMGKQHGSSPFASWYFDVASSNNKLSFATVTSGGTQGPQYQIIASKRIAGTMWWACVMRLLPCFILME